MGMVATQRSTTQKAFLSRSMLMMRSHCLKKEVLLEEKTPYNRRTTNNQVQQTTGEVEMMITLCTTPPYKKLNLKI